MTRIHAEAVYECVVQALRETGGRDDVERQATEVLRKIERLVASWASDRLSVAYDEGHDEGVESVYRALRKLVAKGHHNPYRPPWTPPPDDVGVGGKR